MPLEYEEDESGAGLLRDRDAWVAGIRACLPVALVPPTVGIDPPRVGLAIEYAIGLDLAENPYPDHVSCLPPARADWIRRQVAAYRADRSGSGVGGLLEAGCFLAVVHDIVVKMGLWGSPAAAADQIEHVETRINLNGLWTKAEDELRALWAVYETRAQSAIRGWGRVSASVPLEWRTGVHGRHASAYADLIAGQVLIEVKAGHVDSDWPLVDAYNQISRYVELAPASGHLISSAALYLGRYGLLLRWPVRKEA